MNKRSVLLVGGMSAITAAICFHFSRLEYHIVMAVHGEKIDPSWKALMEQAVCGLDVLEYAADSESTNDLPLHTLFNPQQASTVVIMMSEAESSLPDTLLATTKNAYRLIRIQHDVADDVANAVAGSDGVSSINTIRIRHLGKSERNQDTSKPDIELLNRRSGQAYEVAVLAAYLASDEAKHINNAVVDVYSGRYLT